MDRFEEMKTFIRVVEVGSITRAADQLGLAKSAISRRLSDLEGRLGAELLKRTTRSLKLTETGRAYYDQSQRILNDLAEMEAATSDTHHELSGRLRIAVPLSFGLMHFTDAMNAFLAEHPKLSMDVDLSDRHINLTEENIDVAIRLGRLEDSQLIARHLFPVKTIACASPEYLEKYGVPETPEDLSNHYILKYSLGTQRGWTAKNADGKEVSISPTIRHEANNGDYLRQLGIAGQGFLITPLFIVGHSVMSGQLVPFLEDYSWDEINAYAVYPSTRHLSSRVRTLIDFMTKYYAHQRPWEDCVNRT